MADAQKKAKERPLILVGPDGHALHMQEVYQNPERWQTLVTEEAVLMVARPEGKPRKRDLLEQLTLYVDEHLSRKITLKEVAAHFDVSVSTVTQLFQKKAGTTFHGYLTRRRMIAAEQLIRAGTPLEEVGRQVGYTDHSSFYRAFKQVFGVSPREFRRAINE